jgi:hypothetical protein
MKIHLTLAALVLACATAAWSDVTSGPINDPLAPAAGAGSAGSGGQSPGPSAGNWSAALEKKGSDATSADLSKDLAPEARILNDHLANFDKPGQMPDGKKPTAKTAAQPGVAATGAKVASEAPEDWGSDWANKIRDFVRPIQKEVVNSEVVQVVRELDAVIPKKREAEEPPPAAAPLILPPVGPMTSEEQRRRDKLASSLALEQLIDDLKPYAYALLALAIVGYLGMVFWRFAMWKQGNSARRVRRAHETRTSRSRSAAGASGERDSNAGPTSRSGALTSRAAPPSSRAAPLQSDTENDRLST